jgi:hypothetical protein
MLVEQRAASTFSITSRIEPGTQPELAILGRPRA